MKSSKQISTLLAAITITLCCLSGKLLNAQTYKFVGGTLLGDHHWTKEYIYYVYSNIYIENISTLLIDAGTQIIFESSTGMYVNKGKLLIEGTEQDTVIFSSATTLNWTGIQIKDVNEENQVSLKYVKFQDVETAISIKNSSKINIKNCFFENSYIEGINILDSYNCTVENSWFCNNYKAVVINSNENICSDNIIRNNVFKEGQNAIMVITDKLGITTRNIIEDNIFENSEIAILLSNANKPSTGNNLIRNNVIYSPTHSTTTDNIGIYLQADSVYVDNNIFWNLGNAIEFKDNIYCEITNNTFYENNLCFYDINTQKSAIIKDNTFHLNVTITNFSTYNNVQFTNNNFLLFESAKPTFINNLENNINLSNNYWGTTNTLTIEEAIIDYNDDMNLGKIIYMPLLDSHNINAPISAPKKVTKQFTGEGVLVKWESNKESDFNSYNIYHDNFNNYRYDNVIKNITDTIIYIQGLTLDCDIAVTGCDNQYNTKYYKVSPHESAYSIATAKPFAGFDDTICESIGYISLTQANVPSLFSKIHWETSGSGTFSDSLTLQPDYFPSEEDFTNGEVTLTLFVDKAENSGSDESDEITLYLKKTPMVYVSENNFSLYGEPVMISNVYSMYQDSIEWETFGDGYFDDIHKLHPVYYYGEHDSTNKKITMAIHVYSQCGRHSDTTNYTLINAYNLEGTVSYKNTKSENALVIAANITNGAIERMYKTSTDGEGKFIFNKLHEGNYLLYAIPDTINEQGAPVYYAAKNSWKYANKIKLDGNIYDVDIELSSPISQMLKGTCSISGQFEYPSTLFRDTLFYCNDWYDRDSTQMYCDGGLSNATIMLYNSTEKYLLDYKLTDYKGYFKFDSLPFGSYYVISDMPRYTTSTPYKLILTEQNPEIEGLVFEINNDIITMRYNNEAAENNVTKTSIYPNPCDMNFNIEFSNISSNDILFIEIYNILGEKVHHQTIKGEKKSSIGTSHLPTGIYSVKILSKDNNMTIKNLIISH